jgi:hypothetical protein
MGATDKTAKRMEKTRREPRTNTVSAIRATARETNDYIGFFRFGGCGFPLFGTLYFPATGSTMLDGASFERYTLCVAFS